MPEPESEHIAIYFGGLSTAAALFTFFQAIEQTRRVYRRSNNLLPRPYLSMVWMEWSVNIIWAFISHFALMGVISGKR